jgi:hypothetical protein
MSSAQIPAAAAAIALLSLMPSGASAHHSFAMFDQKKVITLTGAVTEFQWTNPHSFLELDASAPGGKPIHWSIELNSPNNLKRQGWTRGAIRPGDKVTVRLNPLRSGQHGGLFLDVRLPSGKVLDSGLPKDGTPVNVPRA